MVCLHCRASSASNAQAAIHGLRRSADRLRRVFAVSVITTTQVIVIVKLAFVSVHTTRLDLGVNSVYRDSTETPSSDDQVSNSLLFRPIICKNQSFSPLGYYYYYYYCYYY